jgi:hypothetical protein
MLTLLRQNWRRTLKEHKALQLPELRLTGMLNTDKHNHWRHSQSQKQPSLCMVAITIYQQEDMALKREPLLLTAQEGTAAAVAAQFGALPGIQDDLPGAVIVGGAFVVPGALVVANAPEGELREPPLPPLQDVVVAAGPFAQTQTALAEASTAPAELAPHAESTQGAAVA